METLEKYYVITRGKYVQPETINFQRKGAIESFISGTSMTWKECFKHGWRCVKVNITFQPCK